MAISLLMSLLLVPTRAAQPQCAGSGLTCPCISSYEGFNASNASEEERVAGLHSCVTDCLLCAASTCGATSTSSGDRITDTLAGSLIGGLVGFMALLAVVRLVYRNRQNFFKELKAIEEQHQFNLQRVKSAVKKVANLDFYVCFLRFEDLQSHGKLLSHEAVRAKNQLIVLDTFDDVKKFIDANQVAFISHQCASVHSPLPSPQLSQLQPPSSFSPCTRVRWLAGRCPDPENVHFKAIIDAVTALKCRLVQKNDPKASKTFYVWLDFVSIPQANKTLQSLSISSLALYASMPDYFVIVAPPTTHVDTLCACDKESYLRRGWCDHVN